MSNAVGIPTLHLGNICDFRENSGTGPWLATYSRPGESPMSILSARPAGCLVAAAAFSLASLPALAQATGHDWQKTYSVSGSPSLTIETGDSGLEIQSCGDCKEVRVQVHSGRDLNDYRLEEHQEGDHVSF